ncbi:unnamed protein product [Rotaria magnacalcarata]
MRNTHIINLNDATVKIENEIQRGAFADSTPATANIDIDTTQDKRQIKCLNLPNSENIINNNSQLVSDQFKVRITYKTKCRRDFESIVFVPRPYH